jgi:glutamyl-tRNA reductase
MHILCIGLNHNTAPVEIRERFAFSEAIYSTWRESKENSPGGLVVLSTCNRVELYATSQTLDYNLLENLLASNGDAEADILSPHLYHHADESAALHLMRLAAGLDSLVLGEPQILGQITRALQFAQDVYEAKPGLRAIPHRLPGWRSGLLLKVFPAYPRYK